jgi:uncharacterized protein YbjQ (UPF0145 family)
MKVTTVTTYDYTKYETIGIISVMHVESSSFIHEYFKSVKNIASSSRNLLENRFSEARQTCLDKMIKQANDMGASEIIASDIDMQVFDLESNFTTNVFKYIVFLGTGTAIRKISDDNSSMQKIRRSRRDSMKKTIKIK